MWDSVVGREMDGYRILEVLGRGGMGVVYKARNVSLNRVEALKVIAPALVQDDQFLRRFRREAQTLARIQHPNIVTVYTLRHAEIGHYITMEYVEGETLADGLIGPQGMDWREALPIIRQLLAAFAYAHRRGIIHRDIKPRNIMLTADGAVKVMDFGLAKFYTQHDVTHTRGVSGTLCYMSPEQVKGQRNLDQRSDIFSLGMTIYEMLAGRLPFDKDGSAFRIQRTIVEEDFPALGRLRGDIPPALAAAVMKAVEKEPARRYQYAHEMRAALDGLDASAEHQEAPTILASASLSRTSPSDQVATSPRRSWAPWVAGVMLVAGVMSSVGLLYPELLGSSGDGELPAQEAAAQISEEDAITPERSAQQGSGGLILGQELLLQPPAPEAAASGAGSSITTDQQASSASPQADQRATPVEAHADGGEPGEGRVAANASATESGGAKAAGAYPAEQSAMEAAPKGSIAGGTSGSDGPAVSGAGSGSEQPEQGGAGQSVEAGAGQRDASRTPAAEAGQPRAGAVAAERPEVRARSEADVLQGRLQRAIAEQQWEAVPAPLAAYYREVLDNFYAKFEIVKVESTAGEAQAGEAIVALPVTVYISYRQKGREGMKALPIPATWVWREGEGGLTLHAVNQP